MESVWHDIRQAIRTMVEHKAFSAGVLLTLGLGIGANTAMFSIVHGVLLRPLPYDEPEQLMRVSEENPGGTPARWARALLSDVTRDAWVPASKTIEETATFSNSFRFSVGRDRDNHVRVPGAIVSPSLFRVLRVRPAVGRFFHDQDAIDEAAPVVVLGYGLWTDLYAATPAVIGQTLFLNEKAHLIVGVAPPGFTFPDADAAFWLPERVETAPAHPAARRVRMLRAIARLRPGITPEQASAEGTAAARGVPRSTDLDRILGKGGPVQVRVHPLVEEMTQNVRPALVLLMAGVALVLLVACANVANLLLARGHARRREMAVRAALGAPLRRLAQQVIIESLVFAMAGGLLGMVLAWTLVALLPAVAPENFPRLESIRLDWRVLTFSLTASLMAGVLAGVLPAVRGARPGLDTVLRAGDRRTASGSGHVLRSSLLVVEAALAVLLIVSAGLLVRSFLRLVNVDGGFDPSNVLVTQVYLPDAHQRPARPSPFFERLVPRLLHVPGVRAVGVANMAPFGTESYAMAFELPKPGPDGSPTQATATSWVVTPGYDTALGLRVTSGRFLEPEDVDGPTEAMVVNEAFVRLYLDDGIPAIGRRWVRAKEAKLTEIVGVVANVLKDGLDRQPEPEVYRAASLTGSTLVPYASLIVRTTGDPLALQSELRRLARESDPRVGLDGLGSLSGKLSASVAQPRFAAWLLALFAGLALAVAATGLYGVLSYTVSERRREIGIRAALGATRARLVRLVLRQGLGFTLAGLALGLIAAAATSRLLSTLLFGVTPFDRVAFAAAPAVLLLVALAACLVPAWRAASTDPAVVLRAE
jgi:putative ABC transport system permease protein